VTVPFQTSIEQGAAGDVATITATAGLNSVQQTITLIAAAAPSLSVPSEQFARFGKLLQFTVAATDAEHSPVRIMASGAPDEATFDPESGRFEWLPQVALKGRHTVKFTAINSAGVSSSAAVAVSVDEGRPVIDTLRNAASHSTALVCSPGSIATLQGRWLSPGMSDDPSGGRTELAGTTVKVNGEAVPVLHASSNQLDFVCPTVEPGTKLFISAENEFGVTEPVTTVMADAAPGIFSLDRSGQGQGAVTFAGTSDVAIYRNPRVEGQPVQPDDVISVFATGLPPNAHPILSIAGQLTEPVEIIPVQDHLGVWEIRALVPAGIATSDHVALVMQLRQLDNTILKSNEVSFAVESHIPR